MIAVLAVEFRKLNRSLAAALAIAAPSLIALFLFFNTIRVDRPQGWENSMLGACGIWAFFMLPMSVTALTALVAHMEHGPKSWDHLRALPVPRWRLYAAKAVCVLAVVAIMSALVLLMSWGALILAGLVKPLVAPAGEFEYAAYAWTMARMFGAAVLMVAIQLWVALRFSSFVPALVVGIAGTFFSVVATSAKQGVFFPWQMPVNMLAQEPWREQTALALGGGLGLIVLALAVVHLARREVL